MNKKIILYSLIFIALVVACKTAYNPDIVVSANNYLVVEGVINTGTDSTIIKLSRTVNLDNKASTVVETGAKVSVESSDNNKYQLTARSDGTYYYPGLNLDNSKKYRLNITTKDNKVYASDFVQAQITPPIDSVNFKIVNNQVQLFASSHDATNKTRYYRFDYQETWEFHAMYQSLYYSFGTGVKLRNLDTDNIYYCWGNHKSSNIVLGTTAALSQDVLSGAPLTYINSTEEKIERRYSILVHQYALSKEAYSFWSNLKKNTESLGSIFDAQPSALQGNIHCVSNPAEPVLGYISASTVTSKRIFIANSQLPSSWFPVYPYNCRPLDTVRLDHLYIFSLKPVTIPVQQLYAIGSDAIVGYGGASPECADCTIRGTNKRPSYWPVN